MSVDYDFNVHTITPPYSWITTLKLSSDGSDYDQSDDAIVLGDFDPYPSQAEHYRAVAVRWRVIVAHVRHLPPKTIA